MRALVQRVSEASVRVDQALVGQIGGGLLVFLGVRSTDTEAHADYLANKLVQLRIFPDLAGKMNLSLRDVSGQMLVVSQFTLYGDTRKGNRPSFSEAARPELAVRLYEYFVKSCQLLGVDVAQGKFQTHMHVGLVNDGPVTLFLSSDD